MSVSGTQPGVRAPDGNSDMAAAVVSLLSRYVSLTTAQSILKLARERAGNGAVRLDCAQLRRTLDPIERNLRLFLPDVRKAQECRQKLDLLANEQHDASALAPRIVPIRIEDDIVRARNESRNMAVRMGYSPTGQTRLATAVSELARNIVQYVGDGQIQLTPTSAPGIDVVARDRGPGIPNLDQILNGTYKSKLGMGLGLRGVKRLGEGFDIQTGAGQGTTVSFHLRVT